MSTTSRPIWKSRKSPSVTAEICWKQSESIVAGSLLRVLLRGNGIKVASTRGHWWKHVAPWNSEQNVVTTTTTRTRTTTTTVDMYKSMSRLCLWCMYFRTLMYWVRNPMQEQRRTSQWWSFRVDFTASFARHVPLEVSLPTYDGPEGRFCPAKVYEFLGAQRP